MKSILYVGATLMIGASIYGFIDYKKTSRNGDLNRMYESEEVTQPAVEEEKAIPVATEQKIAAVEEKKFVIIPNKVVPKKKTVKSNKVVIDAVEKLEAGTAYVNTYSLKENKSIAPFKKVTRKKLDARLFSRSRPRSYDVVEIKVLEPVKEVVKEE